MHKPERSINIFTAITACLLLFPENANAHSFDGLLPVLWPCIGIFALAYPVPSDSKHLLKVSGILLFITLVLMAIGVVGESIDAGLLLIVLIPCLIVFFIVGMAKKFLSKKK